MHKTLSSASNGALGYAGDITPQQAFQWQQSGEAVLIDVRTDAERTWVGAVPAAIAVAWKHWPGMATNLEFDTQLQQVASAHPEIKKWLFLCRSGARSVAAAQRATALGLVAYNILDGFEGDLNALGQRNQLGGWRFHGLPWQQS